MPRAGYEARSWALLWLQHGFKLGVLFVSVLVIASLLFGVCIRAPDFGKSHVLMQVVLIYVKAL